MTVLLKILLRTSAMVVILVSLPAREDTSAASSPPPPPVRLEAGATRVQHQKGVIKEELRDRALFLRGGATLPPSRGGPFDKPAGPVPADLADSRTTPKAIPLASGVAGRLSQVG